MPRHPLRSSWSSTAVHWSALPAALPPVRSRRVRPCSLHRVQQAAVIAVEVAAAAAAAAAAVTMQRRRPLMLEVTGARGATARVDGDSEMVDVFRNVGADAISVWLKVWNWDDAGVTASLHELAKRPMRSPADLEKRAKPVSRWALHYPRRWITSTLKRCRSCCCCEGRASEDRGVPDTAACCRNSCDAAARVD